MISWQAYRTHAAWACRHTNDEAMEIMNDALDNQIIIELDGVTKLYGKNVGIKDISFSVSNGDFFALLGPNGAGKSTTIRLMTTLDLPSGGSIRINGLDVIRSPLEVRKLIGVVFQTPSLDDDLTAYENMLLHADLYCVPRIEATSRINELIQLVDLAAKKHSQVKTFSGGMKRRLEIIRALLHRPRIIFLDEPTIGLDAQTRNLMWRYLVKLNKSEGVCVFFTTHYLHEVEQFASCVAIIDNGVLITLGSVDEIREKTESSTLEEAYLSLTGKKVRDGE